VYNVGTFDGFDGGDIYIFSNFALSGEGDNVFIDEHTDGGLFYILVILGAVVAVGAGLLFYRLKKQNHAVA
jgi:hypothetical protein